VLRGRERGFGEVSCDYLPREQRWWDINQEKKFEKGIWVGERFERAANDGILAINLVSSGGLKLVMSYLERVQEGTEGSSEGGGPRLREG